MQEAKAVKPPSVGSDYLPYRQLSRLTAEYGANITKELLILFPSDYTRGIIYLLLARLCVEDWHYNNRLVAPRRPTRWFSMHSLAVTLSCPPQTMRRHLLSLMDAGLIVRDGGVALNPEEPHADVHRRFYTFMHDVMIRTISQVAETTDMQVEARYPVKVSPLDVIKVSFDQSLAPLSTERVYSVDWLVTGLWGVLNAINIRSVTFDPVLAKRYAVASSPDGLRKPLSLRKLAAAVSLPYVTAWRCINRMEAECLVTRTEKGWVSLTANLRAEEIEEPLILNMSYFARKVRFLGGLGLDPASADQLYLSVPPDLVRCS